MRWQVADIRVRFRALPGNRLSRCGERYRCIEHHRAQHTGDVRPFGRRFPDRRAILPHTLQMELGASRIIPSALLICDELGYLALDQQSSNLFYQVISTRHSQKRSTIITTNLLCGAPHNRFNAESIFMRTPRSLEGPRRHFAVLLLRILGAAFSISISLSVALKRPVRSFGAITDSRASSFTDGSARV